MDQIVEDKLVSGRYSEVLQLVTNRNDPWSQYYQAFCKTKLSKYDQALGSLEKIIINKKEDELLTYRVQLLDAYIQYRLGVTDDLIDELLEFEKQLALTDLDERNGLIAELYDLIALIYSKIGEMDWALQYIEQATELVGDPCRMDIVGMIYNDHANIKLYAGEYVDAKNFYKLAKRTFEKIDHEYYKGFAIGNMGKLYRIIGETEKAIELATDSMAIKEDFGNDHDLSMEYLNIAILHQILEEYKLAEDYLNKALELRMKVGNIEEISQIHYHQVLLLLEMGDVEKARLRYDHHNKLLGTEINRSILQRDKIMRASLLRHDDDVGNVFDAKQLFADIIEEPVIKLDQTIYCIFNLVEILLLDYKVTESEETIDKIFHYLSLMKDIAREQRIYALVVEILLFQSRLYLMQYKLKRAQAILTQSKLIVEEQGFETMMPKLQKEQKKLKNLFLKWKDLVSENSPMVERIEESDVVNYLSQISKVVTYS